jgi:hypothetical protein
MGEPDKPPWLFYFDNKVMEDIRGLFILTKKGSKEQAVRNIPKSERIRQNHIRRWKEDEYKKT